MWYLALSFVRRHLIKGKRFSHTRYRALGPELIQVYRQPTRRWLFKSSPAVGCHYFPPGLWSPSQPKDVTILWPIPSYTAWWHRHIGVNNLPKVVTQLRLCGNWTHYLLITSPTFQSHCATCSLMALYNVSCFDMFSWNTNHSYTHYLLMWIFATSTGNVVCVTWKTYQAWWKVMADYWIVWHNVHSQQHTYMSSSYRSTDCVCHIGTLTPCVEAVA